MTTKLLELDVDSKNKTGIQISSPWKMKFSELEKSEI
jgi:hypothetical protein